MIALSLASYTLVPFGHSNITLKLRLTAIPNTNSKKMGRSDRKKDKSGVDQLSLEDTLSEEPVEDTVSEEPVASAAGESASKGKKKRKDSDYSIEQTNSSNNNKKNTTFTPSPTGLIAVSDTKKLLSSGDINPTAMKRLQQQIQNVYNKLHL